MQGLILVTWEKFLTDRFGDAFVALYRKAIKQAPSDTPLVSRTYTDEVLQTAIIVAVKLAKIDIQHILYEYGRYFMISPLVNHLYGYVFSRIHNTRDLILVMRKAHMHIGQHNKETSRPLFTCTPLGDKTNGLTVIYESPYQLCALLHGAIVGTGEYYKERVLVTECSCMLKGDKFCRFDVIFEASNHTRPKETAIQQKQRRERQDNEFRVLMALPYTSAEAPSLLELQKALQLRPLALLEALNHLQFAGLISMLPASELVNRRYWRTPTLLQ
jgi:hypothetical protein